MMIDPELFAEEHEGHERIDEARACLSTGMAWLQYCGDCDLLGYDPNDISLDDQLTLRGIGNVMIIAVQKLAAMPPKEGPATKEIIERIWSKARNNI